MRVIKVTSLLIMMLFFSALVCNVIASSNNVSFRSNGVTVNLEFPGESHPSENIIHNVTITSSSAAILRNFTIVIRAPVNSSWKEIVNGQDLIYKQLPVSYSLQVPLPQEVNGLLQCFIFVNTSSIDDLFTTAYTTIVSEPTFSEMLADYTTLQANYSTLLDDYDDLLAIYNSLFANYTALLSENNNLKEKYNTQVANYESLLNSNSNLSDEYETLNSDYQSKTNDYDTLQSDYKTLNSTKNSLQTAYNTLKASYDGLSQDYIDLKDELAGLQNTISSSENALNSDRIIIFLFGAAIAGLVVFIMYIRQKNKEPYIVIRKENSSAKPKKSSKHLSCKFNMLTS